MKLSDRKWKGFKIDDLFTVDKGKYLHKNKILKGNNPYISAKSINNGITGFIGNKTLFPKNTVTIEKVYSYAFYQSHNYYCSHDVSVISNKYINKYVGLFVANIIRRQGEKYSYGRQAQLNVIKRETLYLPVNKYENPDWNFMENYMKKQFKLKVKKYNNFKLEKLKDLVYKKIKKLEEKEWQEFFIIEIFTSIQKGKRLTKANQIKGNIPYISSTSLNNGINNFIGNKLKVRIFKNCLTLANSGSVGSSFYHNYEFIASDHVTHLKNDKMNKYIYLFIATLTKRFAKKYNFNREITDLRISREKILLPINDKNEPDFKFMEQYIKNIMLKKYKQYKSL